MKMHQLDSAHARYVQTRALGFGHREALTWTLTSSKAAEELNAAIGRALELVGPTVAFQEEDLDRLLTLARQHPDATPVQVAGMLVQDVFLSKVDALRQADTSLSYGDALRLAASKFPNEFDVYQDATGQRRRRR